jgi:hypothetical protein
MGNVVILKAETGGIITSQVDDWESGYVTEYLWECISMIQTMHCN